MSRNASIEYVVAWLQPAFILLVFCPAGLTLRAGLPHADLEALMKTNGDHPARVVDIAKSYNLGAYLLHFETRPTTAGPLNGWAHNISELYYVIRGAGTFLIGGELENPKQDDPNGQSVKEVRGPSTSGQIKG